MEHDKLWGGRFADSTNSSLEKLNCSLGLDKRMFKEDVDGSKAYAKALNNIKLLTLEEAKQICDGLDIVQKEWKEGIFVIKDGDEDIHTANERRLKELIGSPATKLHVGRSRNDQVVTDMKLWLKSNLEILDLGLRNLIFIILNRATNEIEVMMPGYTHLQRAQPVRWSHYLLSHAWNFKNDSDRLGEILKHINVMPLGSGALAGNPFNIDRIKLAQSLSFDEITQNSMQAVSDRDFIAEFLFWASMVGIHLSRLAEDFIIYSSKEFEFITIDDSYSTGSSLMPQKRNPDSLELIRGIGGGLFGQEAMFTTFDKLMSILEVTAGTVKTLKVNQGRCRAALSFEMLATDVAYYLVRKGVPFRQAHAVAGQVVAEAEKKEVNINDLTLEELKAFSPHFSIDIGKVWNFENSIEQYQAIGARQNPVFWDRWRSLELGWAKMNCNL
ncbi:hypothetical protein NQ317_012503 [Molorchus minor]|uniref:Argininosuccinate lyase n=1 Tax=Molorchus minor TaxID=1323400 RepID=A0ABQ9K274_9CUCU|nr:hypothetical protein NQ317_012503 [Molorchus minor]